MLVFQFMSSSADIPMRGSGNINSYHLYLLSYEEAQMSDRGNGAVYSPTARFDVLLPISTR